MIVLINETRAGNNANWGKTQYRVRDQLYKKKRGMNCEYVRTGGVQEECLYILGINFT